GCVRAVSRSQSMRLRRAARSSSCKVMRMVYDGELSVRQEIDVAKALLGPGHRLGNVPRRATQSQSSELLMQRLDPRCEGGSTTPNDREHPLLEDIIDSGQRFQHPP